MDSQTEDHLLSRITEKFKTGDTECDSENVLRLLEILSTDQCQCASTETHDKVVKVLEASKGSLLSCNNPSVVILQVEKVVSAVPPSPAMLQTLFTAVEYSLRMCVQTGTSSKLTSALSSLFKATYSQLKAALKVLPSLPTDSPILNSAISALVNVAVAALPFDPPLLALCWKEIGQLFCHVDHHCPASALVVVRELCMAVETKFKECETCEGKLFKVVSFLGSLLGRFVQESHQVDVMSSTVLSCLLTVLSRVYPALLQEQALLMMEAVLLTMVHCQDFLNILLNCPCNDHQALGRLLCLNSLITFLPKLKDQLVEYCLDRVSSLVQASDTCRLLECLFYSLMHTHVQLQLPVRVTGVMMQGRPHRMVTLSEYVTYHLCALCSIVPMDYLGHVERSLFRGILCPISCISLMSIDVWVFHARRYSLPALTDLCQLLLSLTQRVNPPSLSSFLSRLLALLPASSQVFAYSTSQLVSLDPCLLPSLPQECVAASLVAPLHALDPCGVAIALSTADKEQEALLVGHVMTRLAHDLADVDWAYLVKLLSKVSLSSLQICKVMAASLNRWNEARAMAMCIFLLCHALQCDENLASVATCFQDLIGSHYWLVHQLSLEAFTELAKLSGSTVFLENCIPRGYTEAVITFLHKRPCRGWSLQQVEHALEEQAKCCLGDVYRWTQEHKELGDLPYIFRLTLFNLLEKLKHS